MTDKLSIEKEYGDLLRDLVVANRPEVLVEIGTGFGYSTRCLLEGVKKNGIGIVHTYDIEDRDPSLKDERLKRYITEFAKAEFVPDGIEFVFHDAGHWIQHVQGDLTNVLPKMKRKVVVAVHDIIHSFEMGEKLKAWFESMPEWKYEEMRFGCGLGIARRAA